MKERDIAIVVREQVEFKRSTMSMRLCIPQTALRIGVQSIWLFVPGMWLFVPSMRLCVQSIWLYTPHTALRIGAPRALLSEIAFFNYDDP